MQAEIRRHEFKIVRFKERVNALEERVRSLQEENELLYGKLSNLRG